MRRLLRRRLEERYSSAEALEEELREALAGLVLPFGVAEAIAEVRRLSAQARIHKDLVGPLSQDSASLASKLSAGQVITTTGSSA